MDPHLRATRDWDRNYLPTEKEAYHEARINGYVFPQTGYIGNLSPNELKAIASHPPILNLSRYKKYKRMSFDQLEQQFPGVVSIIGSGITEKDLFYYATRGWIPEYDSLEYKINRWNQYNDMSGVGKSLMDMLYTDHNGYVEKLGHPLEPYIIAYDQNLDDDSTVRAIGERIGLGIPQGVAAHDVFYDKLSNHIQTNEPYGYQRIKRQNSSTTKQVMDMTEQQYYNRAIDKGYQPENYSDRLRTIREL